SRIVLHRAGTEREYAAIDGVVLSAEPRVVAHRFRFGQAGKIDSLVTGEAAEAVCRAFIRVRQIDAACLVGADFEDQRLFQHQPAIAGDGFHAFRPGYVPACLWSGGAPACLVHLHASDSCKAAARASISSSITVSVTATSRPPDSSGRSG